MPFTTAFELQILSRSKAARHLMSKSRGPLVRWLLSIDDPGERPPAGMQRVRLKLRLEFDDVDDATEDLAPTTQDIERIITFGALLPDTGTALVHCQAGISRSSAAAVIALTARFPNHPPREIAKYIAGLSADFYPNRLMITQADELLKLKGELAHAIEEVFPEPEI